MCEPSSASPRRPVRRTQLAVDRPRRARVSPPTYHPLAGFQTEVEAGSKRDDAKETELWAIKTTTCSSLSWIYGSIPFLALGCWSRCLSMDAGLQVK